MDSEHAFSSAFMMQWVLNSHWCVLPGRYLKPPLPSSKTLRLMLYGLVEVCSEAGGWLGVTVVQTAKGAPVGWEITGTAVETSSNSSTTRALMFECGPSTKKVIHKVTLTL